MNTAQLRSKAIAPPPMLAIPPTMATSVAPNRFVTIKQLSVARPAFTEPALRDIAFKSDDRENSKGEIIKGNGTGPAGVWIQIGSKRLADIEAFDRWVLSHKVSAK